jgi:hypothetical protein
MAPLSIIGLPHEGKPSALLCALYGPWASSRGRHLRSSMRSGRAAGAALPPPRAWSAPCLPSHVPHDVLTPSRFLLRPQRLTRCAVLVGAETLCESCRPLALPNGRRALSPSSVPPRWLRLVPRIALTVIARADPR